MFSLIITVVAIALVAVLALATLYYGGNAFGKGAARAEASKLVLQGQQLVGAADLYYTQNRAWPTNINDLLTGGYLKQVPNAGVSGIAEAVAAGNVWTMPLANTPMFIISTPANEICAEVNLAASLRKKGILTHAYSNLVAQCFGGSESALKTVFKKAPDTAMTGGPGALDPGDVIVGNPPTDPTDPDWYVEPGATPPGGGGGGGGTDPDPTGSYPPYTGPTDDWYPVDPGASAGGWAANVSALNFGDTAVGTNIRGVVTLTNNTGAPANIEYPYVTVSGLDFVWPDWRSSFPYNESCHTWGSTVPAGGTCTIDVYFTPGAAGALTGSMAIHTTSSDTITIALSGTGVDTSPKPTGLLIHDRFNGPMGPVDARLTDTFNTWMTGYWTNDYFWGCDWHDIDDCGGLLMDGTGRAFVTTQGTMADQVADYHMPVRNYYVELDVEVTGIYEDAFVGIYGRKQQAPVNGEEWDDFVDINWAPFGSWSSLQDASWGNGFVEFPDRTLLPSASIGDHTMRAVFFDDMAIVYIDGTPVAAYPIKGADAGYVGFMMWQRYWDDVTGVGEPILYVKEFRAGTLAPNWTADYARAVYNNTRASMPPPPQPPVPQMCTFPVYAKVHLEGGWQPNRLGRDQFIDPPGWYDYNGVSTYYPRGWAYMWGAQIGTRQAPCN